MSTPLAIELRHETWIWYSVGLTALLARYGSQLILHWNWKSFKADDALMLFCFCSYTVTIVSLNKYSELNTVYTDPTSPESFKIAKLAGILNVLIETGEVTCLWGVKACLLILYYRFTHHFIQQKVVIAAAVYCFLTYVTVIAALYGGFCHPFHDYLVPAPGNIQCVTWFKYNILELTLNVSSDLLIIAIPISVVWNTRMNIGKKLSLCAIFSLGIFVILAAVLTKYFVFTAPIVGGWVRWYIRESSMAIIVGNMVLWRPMLSLLYRKTGSLLSSFGSSRWGMSKGSEGRSEGKSEGRSEGKSVGRSGVETINEEIERNMEIDGKARGLSFASGSVVETVKSAEGESV